MMSVTSEAARMALVFGERLDELVVSALRGLVVGRCMIFSCVLTEGRTRRQMEGHEAESKCPMSVIL